MRNRSVQFQRIMKSKQQEQSFFDRGDSLSILSTVAAHGLQTAQNMVIRRCCCCC